VGISIAAIIVALFLTAAAFAAASIRANNHLCLQQVANDEHASLEAFFRIRLNNTPLHRPLVSVHVDKQVPTAAIGEYPLRLVPKGR